MKKRLVLLVVSLIVGFSSIAFAGHVGIETTLQGIYGSSWDWSGSSPYDLWRVLSDAGYTSLANDVYRDIKGLGPSANYHVYQNSFWQTVGDYSSRLVAEVAGYASRNRFGWYEQGHATDVGNPSKTTWGELFSGSNTSGAVADFANSKQIGFWINPNGIPYWYYFTDSSSNLLKKTQAVTFPLGDYPGFDDEYLICFEDLLYCGADKDFQDMIVRLQLASPPPPPPIPEPSTLSLLAWGVLGLAKFRKRRRN